MKQTAVEWLENELQEYFFHGNGTLEAIWKQAKEMEKEQMVDFAFKYGDLTTRQIADAFDNEYKK
jgi:hypothetical protein